MSVIEVLVDAISCPFCSLLLFFALSFCCHTVSIMIISVLDGALPALPFNGSSGSLSLPLL